VRLKADAEKMLLDLHAAAEPIVYNGITLTHDAGQATMQVRDVLIAIARRFQIDCAAKYRAEEAERFMAMVSTAVDKCEQLKDIMDGL
jgi:hypothetical protein